MAERSRETRLAESPLWVKVTRYLTPSVSPTSAAARVIAPAHPGCAQSDELAEGYGIENVVFHYLEVFDALGLTSFDLVGHCVGGWIAARPSPRPCESARTLL